MSKKNLIKLVKQLHLYIGLFTGIVVFIVCITGCIYAFQKEIRLLSSPYYTVSIPLDKTEKLPLSKQLDSYKSIANSGKVQRIYDLQEKNRSTLLLVTRGKEYYFSFLNPYTGELLAEKALARDFFYIVLYIHMNLLLGTVGSYIVKWSVLLFLISLITGLILWWPKKNSKFKNRKFRNTKFSINKKTSNKFMRRYRQHSVWGFYVLPVLIVVSITGLAWGLAWVDEMLYTAVTFEKKVEYIPPKVDSTILNLKILDEQQKIIAKNYPNKGLVMYFLPMTDEHPLWIRAVDADDTFSNADEFYLHPQSGKVLEAKLYKDLNKGEKFRIMYYELHTGSILGLPGKFLVFFASLIAASLPITGFMMWRSKKRSRKLKINNK